MLQFNLTRRAVSAAVSVAFLMASFNKKRCSEAHHHDLKRFLKPNADEK